MFARAVGSLAGCLALVSTRRMAVAAQQGDPTKARSIYEFRANSIDGVPVDLAKYEGKVMVVVNVASK